MVPIGRRPNNPCVGTRVVRSDTCMSWRAAAPVRTRVAHGYAHRAPALCAFAYTHTRTCAWTHTNLSLPSFFSLSDLQRALEIDPNDKGLKRELNNLTMKMKKQEEKEKMLFAKMFSG